MNDEAKIFMRYLMGDVAATSRTRSEGWAPKMDTLTSWKPELEKRIAELHIMVSELHVPRLFINLMPPSTSRRCLLPQDLDFSFGFLSDLSGVGKIQRF
jgi:hypothetical protein